MQLCHSGDQTESKAVAGRATALLKPVKALQRLVPFLFRNTRARVRKAYTRLFILF